jgi:membrane associated rhomboid family serine protease
MGSFIAPRIAYTCGFTLATYFACATLDDAVRSLRVENPGTVLLSASNLVVFLNSRRIANSRYFVNSLFSPKSSMTLSCFNHAGLGHLGMNMLALNSFGPYVESKMGSGHFIAFYLSCGTISSIVSLLYKRYMSITIPSVGASGAVCSVIGASAHEPGIRVAPIFLPFSMPIEQAFPSLVVMDTIGIFRGKSPFDHAAHLGGSLSGYLGYGWSFRLWNWMRSRWRPSDKYFSIYIK